jgi:hypothetical protein
MIAFWVIHSRNPDLLRYDAQTFAHEWLNQSLHCGESMARKSHESVPR